MGVTLDYIWDALRDLVPFVQFKNLEKHPWRSGIFNLKAILLHRCFPHFQIVLMVSNRTKHHYGEMLKLINQNIVLAEPSKSPNKLWQSTTLINYSCWSTLLWPSFISIVIQFHFDWTLLQFNFILICDFAVL